MNKITIIGTGYVGLVTGACFAELGHNVVCIDIDEKKIEALRHGALPIFEPGLEEYVPRNVDAGRLSFTTRFESLTDGPDFVFVSVGTPITDDRIVDVTFLRNAYLQIARHLAGPNPIVVNKSTVPPGTTESMARLLWQLRDGRAPVQVVMNPEFLREGHAIADFMAPTRVVVGATDPVAGEAVMALYRPFRAPEMLTSTRTAELIKLASNAFLATKLSFIHEIASLCERDGINVTEVARGIGMDPRIGRGYLKAGLGYGGSCLPKDVGILASHFASRGARAPLLNAVATVNADQPSRFVHRIERALGDLAGTTIAVLGLAFKANTDDVRNSPAIETIRLLQARGSRIRVYDPQATVGPAVLESPVFAAASPYEAAEGADAIVIATDWHEFRSLDLARIRQSMSGRLLADGRQIVPSAMVMDAGLAYLGVGIGSPEVRIPEESVVGSGAWE